MAFLPSTPLTLHGGCSCNAAKYTITIPSLSERPIIPSVGPVPTSATTSAPNTTFPVIALCHCISCRRASGALFFSWIVLPPGWVTWDVALRKREVEVGSSWPGNGAVKGSAEGMREKGEEERRTGVDSVALCGPADANDDGAASLSTYVTQHRSSERAIRTFCARCGTTLTYYHVLHHGTEWAMLDVSVGSLDEESIRLVRPERHVFWDHGVEWVRDLVRWGTGGWMMRNGGEDGRQPVRDDEEDGERKGEEGKAEESAWSKLHVDGYGDGQIRFD